METAQRLWSNVWQSFGAQLEWSRGRNGGRIVDACASVEFGIYTWSTGWMERGQK